MNVASRHARSGGPRELAIEYAGRRGRLSLSATHGDSYTCNVDAVKQDGRRPDQLLDAIRQNKICNGCRRDDWGRRPADPGHLGRRADKARRPARPHRRERASRNRQAQSIGFARRRHRRQRRRSTVARSVCTPCRARPFDAYTPIAIMKIANSKVNVPIPKQKVPSALTLHRTKFWISR